MGIEYERKYLVSGDQWRSLIKSTEKIRQGYIAVTATSTVRVRVRGQSAHLTVKSAQMENASRIEVESEISHEDAGQLLDNLCSGLIDKIRHTLNLGPEIWTIDVFEGANLGLVLLEVESGEHFEMTCLPPWVGAEVTQDERYQNSYLSRTSYSTWPDRSEDRNDS